MGTIVNITKIQKPIFSHHLNPSIRITAIQHPFHLLLEPQLEELLQELLNLLNFYSFMRAPVSKHKSYGALYLKMAF